jgi:hypothetical protein
MIRPIQSRRAVLRPGRILCAAVPRVTLTAVVSSVLTIHTAIAQNAPASSQALEQKVQRLTDAVAHTQTQLEVYQKQLQQLQEQLAEVQRQLAEQKASAVSPGTGTTPVTQAGNSSSRQLDEIRERQAIQESQIATHEQTKVETESKYPLKISGLVLFNGFVNTSAVDSAVAPTYTYPGGGTTGLSLRQTVLGLDARGPHLFGATSRGDLRVDFFARDAESSYSASGLLRLRTAHASLNWKNTDVLVQQDRSFLEPNAPTSLVAVAQPEFSWSGNLWVWNPQIGFTQKIGLSGTRLLKFQGGLIDAADPRWPGIAGDSPEISAAERSRWPGSEARAAFASGDTISGPEIGLSGYFSPHENTSGDRFNAWAGAMDLRLPIAPHLSLMASAYRGAALGGLGGGGYVDYVYLSRGTAEIARALDDVGGWTQLKAKLSERLEFNGGYGIDDPFDSEIRASTRIPEYSIYHGLLKNRSAFGNVIYSPSTYLLFSLEYRRLWSNYLTGPTSTSNVIGIAAGYRF